MSSMLLNYNNGKKLTLRQIEVIRAVMIAGSIAGAARLLNVAQPGVSRTMKHLEGKLGINLFIRQGGRYVPAPEARDIFNQLQEVYNKLSNLQISVLQLEQGQDVELAIGSVPSIAHVMVPKAVATFKKQFPMLLMNIELLKLEEAIDYLMLRRGEVVCISHKFDHPAIKFENLAQGTLICLAHRSHPIAKKKKVSVEDIAQHPLIGIDPKDPYGSILASIFEKKGLDYNIIIRARFGSTVMGLVRENLGIAVLDSFSTVNLAYNEPDLIQIPITNIDNFETYVALRKDCELSGFAKSFIMALRATMNAPSAAI